MHLFESTSSTQPEVLSWGEGYYSGDIKTRKTSQGVELNSDQIGLQRSEQLRELYKSRKAVEASPQTKRRSAALSPEDLTDTEGEEAGWDVLITCHMHKVMVNLIMQELQARGINNKHTLAYQNQVGPIQWLKPYTDETLIELGQIGVKSLLAVPVSFVSEHIETLKEIDMEYREFGRCM
ncbi:hypothetical protein S83_034960 [Arachis hypogaea]